MTDAAPAERGSTSASKGPLIFIVAGEESGDRLGAPLIRALRQRLAGEVRFAGVGGHAMAAEGLRSLFPIDDLAIIGFTAIARKLRFILRRIAETAQAVVNEPPDVLVIIDSPDFTHRVARRVRKAVPTVPIVDYVSPSVWAWRPGRARAMTRYVDPVLALLPFEQKFHAELGGPRCFFVGHPLVVRAAALRPNAQEGARRAAEPPVVLVLPGSRANELKRLGHDFAKTLEIVRAQYGPIEAVLPTTPRWHDRVTQMTADWAVKPRIVVDAEEKDAAFRTARAALAKSGTVTLELAVAGVPMVTAYKMPAIEMWVARRVVTTPSVILANLVIGENVVPEFLQDDCNPQALAAALLPLLRETPERRRQVEAFSRLDAIMEIGRVIPSLRAADLVLASLSSPRN
jgi:lipid-A-disaccharide synthase